MKIKAIGCDSQILGLAELYSHIFNSKHLSFLDAFGHIISKQ